MLNRSTFINLALLTLFGFGLAAYFIINTYTQQSFWQIITGEKEWYFQLGIGIAYGLLVAIIGWMIIKMPFQKATKNKYAQLIQSLDLKISDIILVSFCAGVGEELFFRGAIQPLAGIWFTAIIFVALHGYLNPFNWQISIYGFYMTMIIAGIGYMKIHFGLASSMIAHTVIDVYLLYKLNNEHLEGEPQAETSDI